MKDTRRASASIIFIALFLLFSEDSEAFPAAGVPRRGTTTTITTTTQLYNTGGWGIGPQRELTPEEFAKGGRGGRSRSSNFEGYQLRDRGEFMRQVAQDRQELERSELEELLGVARQAGIAVKDPKERLNKFELDDVVDDDDDDLDLSVQWEDDNDVEVKDSTASSSPARSKGKSTDADSITRLDEDTGASGVW